ncbi:MAG: cupin domain-containing protein [Gemmataceae bacterium]
MNGLEIHNLTDKIQPPAQGMIHRLVFQDDQVKVIGFGFAAEHILNKHTAPRPVMLTFISGEATVEVGEETTSASAGTWIHIPADVPHSIHATKPVVMLLVMLK